MVADVELVRRHLESEKYKRLQRTAATDFDTYKVRAGTCVCAWWLTIMRDWRAGPLSTRAVLGWLLGVGWWSDACRRVLNWLQGLVVDG